MRRRHSAATPAASIQMQAADMISGCSMAQKRQRTNSNGSGRKTVKGANAQVGDAIGQAIGQAEQVATLERRGDAFRIPADEAVRTRAYYLFLERGGRAGHELDDWLRAESEIRV